MSISTSSCAVCTQCNNLALVCLSVEVEDGSGPVSYAREYLKPLVPMPSGCSHAYLHSAGSYLLSSMLYALDALEGEGVQGEGKV